MIAVAQVFEDASEYGVKGPFERIRKYEADMFCYASYGKAVYEPAAAIEFWRRFCVGVSQSRLEGGLDTSPRDEARVRRCVKICLQPRLFVRKRCGLFL